MRVLWNFTGRAAPFADRVQGPQLGDFQIDGGAVEVPNEGDLEQLRVSGRGDAVWFKCSGRRFDFAPSDEPVLPIDLELA